MNLEETIENYTIQSEESILHSLEKMDAHGVKNLIVISEGRAAGVLTDGDLRRGSLKEGY